jgi:hypothetical protein
MPSRLYTFPEGYAYRMTLSNRVDAKSGGPGSWLGVPLMILAGFYGLGAPIFVMRGASGD